VKKEDRKLEYLHHCQKIAQNKQSPKWRKFAKSGRPAANEKRIVDLDKCGAIGREIHHVQADIKVSLFVRTYIHLGTLVIFPHMYEKDFFFWIVGSIGTVTSFC
jgi:hypothetical protein